MAKIETISVIEGIRGKLDGTENLVFSKRYGQTYAWEMRPSTKEPTAAQLAVQSRFAEAAQQAATDMKDPEKREEWKEIAEASNGKWKTPRGAAFASYYAASEDVD